MTDVAIIGAYGSAGVATAEILSEREEIDSLYLIDDGDPGGGLCILRGCMPSKEVLSAAAHRYHARHDTRIEGSVSVDLDEVISIKDDHIHNFAEHRREAVHSLAENDNVEFIHGTAEFVDDHTIQVNNRELPLDYIVIASGSDVNIPDIEGIEDVNYMTSKDVLSATEFPESGIVFGFGYVGLELVPYLSEAAEMDITVIEHDKRPLDRADDRFGDEILDQYREEFDIDILTETYEKTVTTNKDGSVSVTVETNGDTQTITADQLFLFTGRNPTLSKLNLSATSIQVDEGWVNDTLQTRNASHIYAAGDVIGDRMILHMAKEEGYLAGENIIADINNQPLEEYDPLHHTVIFTGGSVYPYASLGLTAAEAQDQGYDPVVVSREAKSDGVFKTKATPRGLAKLIVAQDGTVLGYHGLHYHADVMAKSMQIILEREMQVQNIPDRAYHPTTPEILDGLFRDAKSKLPVSS
ncbi:MAG: NAD(P)/FAD-dependent oxidoreductase [Halobacteriaceae archaeon]